MSLKTTISLDELDVKCLTELPVILDVLSATGNKLTRIFNPLYDNLSEFVLKQMPKEWKQSKESYKGVFYPFTDSYRKDDILTLYSYFAIYYQVELVSNVSTSGDSFIIHMGFYYNPEDESTERSCHYFQITHDTNKKVNAFNDLAFYKGIQSTLHSEPFDVRIYHPTSGEKQEDIAILVYDHSVDAINNAFDVFKEKVLSPFLQSVK